MEVIRDMVRYGEPDLLGGNIKCDSPEVNLLIMIYAGQDKEYPRTSGSSWPQSPQPEYDRSLVLLDNLNTTVRIEFSLSISSLLTDLKDWKRSGSMRKGYGGLTLTQKKREMGRVTAASINDSSESSREQKPGPGAPTEQNQISSQIRAS